MNTLSTATGAFGRALRGQVSAKTRRWYISMLQSLVLEYGDLAVPEVMAAHLLEWYANAAERRDAGEISTHTLYGYVTAAHRLFRWLAEAGHIQSDVSACLRLPELPDNIPKAIAAADLQLLMNHCKQVSKRDFTIVCFLADTGCRAGGLLGLQRENVYLDDGRAIVQEKRGKLRPVFFGRITYGALCAWLAERTDNDPHVFVSRHNQRLSYNGLYGILKRRAEQAGCQGRVNPHSFRHAFAREFLRNGGELSALGRLLGHEPGSPVTAQSYAVWEARELQGFHQQYAPLSVIESQSTTYSD